MAREPMPAERSKLSATRTSKRFVALVLVAGLALAGGNAHAERRGVVFVSHEAAPEQGIGASRGGFSQQAPPVPRTAAGQGLPLGQSPLALLDADNAGATTEHVKAHDRFREIVERNARVVDVDDEMAFYVGKSLTALARYDLNGLPEHGLRKDAIRAAEYLQQADTFFGDPDAKCELAKMYLTGVGVDRNMRQGLTRLTNLKDDGHIAATAFYASLLWEGKLLQKNEVEALRLIRWAVEMAPVQERIWIEDTYRSIYCGASTGVRQQAEGQIAGFHRSLVPRPMTEAEERLGIAPKHTCDNGEPLPLLRETRNLQESNPVRGAGHVPPAPPAPSLVPGVMDIRGANPVAPRR